MNFYFYDDDPANEPAPMAASAEESPEAQDAESASETESVEPEKAAQETAAPEAEAAPEVEAEPEVSEADRLRDQLVRMKADFDNYRKRNARDFLEMVSKSSGDILAEFLSPLDNLERAIDTMRKTMAEDDPCLQGVLMVQRELLGALERHGVKPVDTKVGAELDPNLEEALGLIPAPGIAEGHIAVVVRKGYTLNGKVLRAAQVMAAAAAD